MTKQLSWGLDDVTKDSFEDSFVDMFLSPCMLSRTMINPEEVDDSESDSEDFQLQAKKETPRNKARQIYLITYSRADVSKVTSRENFANIVCAEFSRNDQVVQQWAVSAKLHREAGLHYHLVLKLKCPQRFRQVRLNLKLNHEIDVDFQTWQGNYYSAFTYVTKFDTHYVSSENHSVLSNPPNTTKATATKRSCSLPKESIRKNKKKQKAPRLLADQVGEIFQNKQYKN